MLAETTLEAPRAARRRVAVGNLMAALGLLRIRRVFSR
jgi:hypothetical protein